LGKKEEKKIGCQAVSFSPSLYISAYLEKNLNYILEVMKFNRRDSDFI